MICWERGRYAIEMTDEPAYSFGSGDNARLYRFLESECYPLSEHYILCALDGEPCASAVLSASGGGTEVHENSCVLLEDRCLVAVGDRVVALGLPDFRLLWQAKADDITCFGLFVTPDERHVVVHGELRISKLTVDGDKEWEFTGRDIFTGASAIEGDAVVVTDFDGYQYSIDLELGTGRIVGSNGIEKNRLSRLASNFWRFVKGRR
ncbi:MAG: hypothetical protein GY842_16875 [bacterium]|nr:hypothetical protein [bacterium]